MACHPYPFWLKILSRVICKCAALTPSFVPWCLSHRTILRRLAWSKTHCSGGSGLDFQLCSTQVDVVPLRGVDYAAGPTLDAAMGHVAWIVVRA